MSEEALEEAPSADPARTGVPAVDSVLESIAALEDRPLEEHVAAFESAHDRLRRALDAGPEQS